MYDFAFSFSVTKFQQLMQHEEGARLVQEAQAYHKDRHSQSFHPHAVTRGMETLVVFACYSVEDASEGVNTDIAMDMYSMTEIREEVSSQNLNETENVKLEATRAQKMSEVQKVGGKKGVDKVVEGAGQKELKVQERSVGCTCEIGSLCLVQAGHFVFLFGTHSPREQSSEDRSAGLAAKAYKTFSRRFDASSGDWLQLAPVPMCGHVGSAVCPSEEAILLIGGGLIKDVITLHFSSSARLPASPSDSLNNEHPSVRAVETHPDASCACDVVVLQFSSS